MHSDNESVQITVNQSESICWLPEKLHSNENICESCLINESDFSGVDKYNYIIDEPIPCKKAYPVTNGGLILNNTKI